MAAVSGIATTFTLPNYVGELFHLTAKDTPFLSMIGGLTGGKGTSSKRFTWQTDDNPTVSQPAVLEAADATFSERDRAEVFNVVQIFQEGISVSYTKQATTGQLGNLPSGSPAASSILGNQPVMDEMGHQRQLKLIKIARDIEYTFLHGTFAEPNDNATARKTRGLVTAITTNTVAAGSAQLAKSHIDTLLRTMVGNDAPLNQMLIMCGAYNKQKFSQIYGYAPESRTVGGVNIETIMTDFGEFGIVFNRYLTASTVVLVDLSVCAPVMLEIPGKGFLFSEPLAVSGAYWKEQIYGEVGLEYGPERWHGTITGTATS
jgi:Family of unknown function (DUF5309)